MKIRLLSIVMLLGVMTACTAPQTRSLRASSFTSVTAPVEIQGVPFFAQEEHQCGPAALATMLKFSGLDVTPAALTEKVYVPGREGSFAVELAAAARQ